MYDHNSSSESCERIEQRGRDVSPPLPPRCITVIARFCINRE